jgi:hypothetical protein
MAPNPLVYGASSSGSFPAEPLIIPFQPPFTGNPQYTVGLGDAFGQTLSLLAIAAASGATVVNGIPINVALAPFPELLPVMLSGPAGIPGAGYGSVTVPIPNLPGLAGQQFFLQWFVPDPLAPGGIAASRGLQGTIF